MRQLHTPNHTGDQTKILVMDYLDPESMTLYQIFDWIKALPKDSKVLQATLIVHLDGNSYEVQKESNLKTITKK